VADDADDERTAFGEREDSAEDAGRFLRPPVEMVAPAFLVPDSNLIQPPPNRFTHELVRDEPFRYDEAAEPAEPDGILAKGTRVVVLVEGEICWVVDGSGLYVAIHREGLRRLTEP
jgi:hypothetical protein